MVRKTTSLKVDEEIWKKVKIKCIQDGVDISDFVEELLKEGLKKK
jgi:hypothetical protein